MRLLLKIDLTVVTFVALVLSGVFYVAFRLGVPDLKKVAIIVVCVGLAIVIPTLLIISIIVHRRVIKPLRHFKNIAEKISEGDLNQVVDYVSKDSVGEFGAIFGTTIDKLRQFDEVKSAFNSVAAHQLRTPLAGMKWVVKALLDGDEGPLTEGQKTMLLRAYETNENMIQLVNNLLYVSRIENGRFGYDFKVNDFLKVLQTISANSEMACRQRNIEFRIDNRATDVGLFTFDMNNLVIALQNIVDNAIKYTPPGGKINILVTKQGGLLEVKVTDTGIGIPREELAKLFSKFFRASNVKHLEIDGTGLGLFITKSIINRHGGNIVVESVEGSGTTMTITIALNLGPDGAMLPTV